jgi:hypothetical protein
MAELNRDNLGTSTQSTMHPEADLLGKVTEPVSEFVRDLSEEVPVALEKSLTYTKYFALACVFLVGWGLFNLFKPKDKSE